MKILLPNSVELAPSLPPGAHAVTYDAAAPIPEEHLDAEVLVVWANRNRHLREIAGKMPNLRLVQALLAGTDTLLRAGFPEDVIIASGVGLHDKTVTEHALTLTLSLVRRLPQCALAQAEHRWASELGGYLPLHPPGPITTLLDANVLIWGFGSIGQTLAPVLSALGANVRGVAQTAGERSGFETITDAELPAALAETDLLVMVLPATEATHHALNAKRLAQLNPDAFVVNVGRGSTVEETALTAALSSGHLAGAALDVTEVEPLPPESPLWDAPRLLLTPHAAGGRPVGADELISANVAALHEGNPLRNVVAR